jgi:hypothetical protein
MLKHKIVRYIADYLDRGSIIQWSFTSQDTRYNIAPEGYIMSLDTGLNSLPICSTRLIFYYISNTIYQNLY